MSKITNDGLTRSGTGCFIWSNDMATVGVNGLKKQWIQEIPDKFWVRICTRLVTNLISLSLHCRCQSAGCSVRRSNDSLTPLPCGSGHLRRCRTATQVSVSRSFLACSDLGQVTARGP